MTRTKANTILVHDNEQTIPCALGKVGNRPCTLLCAFEHGCPVCYVDTHDMPIVRRLKPEDLEPMDDSKS